MNSLIYQNHLKFQYIVPVDFLWYDYEYFFFQIWVFPQISAILLQKKKEVNKQQQ